MHFLSAAPSVVRSVLQRNMLNAWLRLHDRNHQIPALEEYVFDRIEEIRPDLVYYEVVYTDAGPRFRLTYQGSRLAETFSMIGQGLYIDDVIGPELASLTLPVYFECLSSCRPLYSIFQVPDIQSRKVSYERLLLPFGNGMRVGAIIASIQTICDDGAFVRKGLMRNPGMTLVYSTQAVINTGFAATQIAKQMDGDVVEI